MLQLSQFGIMVFIRVKKSDNLSTYFGIFLSSTRSQPRTWLLGLTAFNTLRRRMLRNTWETRWRCWPITQRNRNGAQIPGTPPGATVRNAWSPGSLLLCTALHGIIIFPFLRYEIVSLECCDSAPCSNFTVVVGVLSADTNRFGYQLMTKMGWEKGKGLGAKEHGQTSHVKAFKRRNNQGEAPVSINPSQM